jgi:hypothetical protein
MSDASITLDASKWFDDANGSIYWHYPMMTGFGTAIAAASATRRSPESIFTAIPLG